MKYSELIDFKPIESTIQLLETAEKNEAQKIVSTYVMSDSMAEGMKAPVIDQLQMDEVIDNKAVMVVGNFGTGKSHLMSLIAAVASDKDNLQFLQNKKFAQYAECIAGKFEVLRMKVDGVTMPLREIIMGEIEDDFAKRGIEYEMPDLEKVRDNSKIITNMMEKFQNAYPDKGYLIVIDELLSYLTSRDERQIVLDLAFLQSMAEKCSKTRLRVMCGVQEKVFDNPRFSFVSDTLKKVGDRFTQIIITKEATAYVVSERILKKTSEQKALIREHLEKFTSLYAGMSSRLEEFVDLFPIHPSYIDVFNRIYLIENRHILKNISICIKNIFDTEVPTNAPGIISFDDYWPAIKSNGILRSDVVVSRVVNASQQLEDIINRAFPKPAYKPIAKQIIYALSVHRLTTNGLDVQFGMTAENLRDELCLFLPMPEQDADFLLGAIKATMRDIMSTVSGQFIIYNESNNQYFIDVDKIVDYDEKIKQKSLVIAESELNTYFYKIVYSCLEWDAKQYVTNFDIYEYDINWESHNIYREGYLFMGIPEERSTAQPERDFYIHIMPPYGINNPKIKNLSDEIYLFFEGDNKFKEMLSLYAASMSLAQISEGKDKDVYLNKALFSQKNLVRHLSENKNTCFKVVYDNCTSKLIEVLKGKYYKDMTFKDTIDLVASIEFEDYFKQKYPEVPIFKTKVTRKNCDDLVKASFDYFAGRKTQQSKAMLESFDILDNEKINPRSSKYAKYYIDKIESLSPQGVINFSDIFCVDAKGNCLDNKFSIDYKFLPIIFLSMVYAGYVVITLKNGKTITASTLSEIPRIPASDLFEFKYLSKPAQIPLAELKYLFDALDLNSSLVSTPNEMEKGLEALLQKSQELSYRAGRAENMLKEGFELWGEPLVSSQNKELMRIACQNVNSQFSNYRVRFNTVAKLNTFSLSIGDIDYLLDQIKLVELILCYNDFRIKCSNDVAYISNIESIDLEANLRCEISKAKEVFRAHRDKIMQGTPVDTAVHEVLYSMKDIKNKYIDYYYNEHRKKRLGINDAQKRNKILESTELAKLKELCKIDSDIFPRNKLTLIEKDATSLEVCYELTPEELKTTHVCKHCKFIPNKHEINVEGQLDIIENRITELLTEWTETLVNTISDPIVASQKEYLPSDQKSIIDAFISSRKLPNCVDDYFVNAINSLLKGFEPVVIDSDDLLQKLEKLPPLDVKSFSIIFKEILEGYIKGKDLSKLRIIVKRKI